MDVERTFTAAYPHFGMAGEGLCATMGALSSSPFYSIGGIPPDFIHTPCDIGCESTDFPDPHQCLLVGPWGTSDHLMPTREFGDRCLDLLEGSSSTPWSSAGYDDDLLLDLSSGNDCLDTVLMDPGKQAEFGSSLSEGLQVAPSDVPIHGWETDTSSRHRSDAESFCITAHSPQVVAWKGHQKAKKGSPVLPVRQPSSRGERQRRPNVAADVTMELLEAGGYLDMPLMEAARALNITVTILKPRLRELGIEKWPSRKRKSLRRLLETAQTDMEPLQHFDGDISELNKLLQAEIKSFRATSSENWALIRKVRNTAYKSTFKRRHRKRERKPEGPSTPPLPALSTSSVTLCSSPADSRAPTVQDASEHTCRCPPKAARSGSAPPGVAWGAHGYRERRGGRRAKSIY
ncbi:g10978 [Coccomyxa elongata]